MSEPAYVVENERELARLRAFVGSASDEDLATPMPEGWTVGSVLAHAAFWAGRVFAIMEARDGGMEPPPYHEEAVDWINDAAKPFLLALGPREAAELAVRIAERTDARIAAEPVDRVLAEAETWLNPERWDHRREHLDEIHEALGRE